jgi:Tfp pilus assembly protein PilN
MVLYGGGGRGEVMMVGEGGVRFSRSFNYDVTDAIHSVQEAVHPILESLEQKNDVRAHDLCVAGELEKMKDQLFVGEFPNRFGLPAPSGDVPAVDFLLFAAANIFESAFDDFNLLPEEVKQTIAVEKSAGHTAGLRLSLVALLAALVLTSIFSSLRLVLALSSVNQKLSELEPSIRETKEVSRSIRLMEAVNVRKIRPIDLFARAHEEAPDGILLNEFEYAEKEQLVRLKGRAGDQSLVQQYVRKLEAVPWFSRVDLQYSESTSEGSYSQFQFVVLGLLKKLQER